MFGRLVYTRYDRARRIREEAAELAARRPTPDHLNNGEESQYRDAGGLSYIANYSKGLPHTFEGEVDRAVYQDMLWALSSGSPGQFERITLGTLGGLKLINPQAGLAFDLEGPDAQSVTIPPAPRIDEPEVSGEMGELYWMAVCRDVNFHDYGTGLDNDRRDRTIPPGLGNPSRTGDAAASLSEPAVGGEFSIFRGPKVGGVVTPATLFRGLTPGDLVGPFISQFLLQNIPYVSQPVQQNYLTVPTTDFLTTFPQWLNAQNGVPPLGSPPNSQPRPTLAARHISNLRDLATFVHFDRLYEQYMAACLILLNILPSAPFDQGNPYNRSRTQDGFTTFGAPHILTLLAEVGTRAQKAVWFQKWGVHRRLRPEEFGGRIHVHRFVSPGKYPMIDQEIRNALQGGMLNVFFPAASGTYLLPQAFAEGAPNHPAYGAGHATVAGACCTMLKAFFDESFVISNPVVPDPANLMQLIPYVASMVEPPLTVGGELNKLAGNISLGRNAAGVHWRSDYTESIRLGEEIAIRLLQEQKRTYNENHFFSLTKFDGTAITI
jgi:hypothetical protein